MIIWCESDGKSGLPNILLITDSICLFSILVNFVPATARKKIISKYTSLNVLRRLSQSKSKKLKPSSKSQKTKVKKKANKAENDPKWWKDPKLWSHLSHMWKSVLDQYHLNITSIWGSYEKICKNVATFVVKNSQDWTITKPTWNYMRKLQGRPSILSHCMKRFKSEEGLKKNICLNIRIFCTHWKSSRMFQWCSEYWPDWYGHL